MRFNQVQDEKIIKLNLEEIENKMECCGDMENMRREKGWRSIGNRMLLLMYSVN